MLALGSVSRERRPRLQREANQLKSNTYVACHNSFILPLRSFTAYSSVSFCISALLPSFPPSSQHSWSALHAAVDSGERVKWRGASGGGGAGGKWSRAERKRSGRGGKGRTARSGRDEEEMKGSRLKASILLFVLFCFYLGGVSLNTSAVLIECYSSHTPHPSSHYIWESLNNVLLFLYYNNYNNLGDHFPTQPFVILAS